MSTPSPIFGSPPDTKPPPGVIRAPATVADKQSAAMPEPELYLPMTQSLDISFKLLRSFWEMQEWSHKRIEEEFKKLREAHERFAEEKEEVEARATAAELKAQEAQERFEAADSERQKAIQELQNVKSKEEQKLKEQVIEFQNGFWPACLNTSDLEQWRVKLQDKAKMDGGAALLMAAIHRFCAAEKCQTPQELLEALQYLGKRLYAESNGSDIVDKVGGALNQSADRRFQLRFPTLGEPTDTRWMNYQAGLAQVQQVTNWAVCKFTEKEGEKLEIVSKAEVASHFNKV
jgi:hypothetical protein